MLRTIGRARAACDNSVQIVYKHQTRPSDKCHQPWLDRITGQQCRAFAALECECAWQALPVTSASLGQDGVDVAVASHLAQQMVPEAVGAARHPALCAHSRHAEALAEFRAAPHGPHPVGHLP